MMPETCPKCGTDFRGDPIPKEVQEQYGEHKYLSRVIGIVDRDRVTHWKCPDCGFTWPRGPLVAGPQQGGPCPYGCLFREDGTLFGDCRIPWANDCEMNRREFENVESI